jgi:DNA-binding response OmpR family regulator
MTDPSHGIAGSPDPVGLPREPATLGIAQLPTRLLYVEDDDDLRDMIALEFVDAGFDVTAVSSAETALEELQRSGYDILLTDYNLTGETGRWLLEQASLKGLLQQTAAMVLTSERSPAGVSGYKVLSKPIDFGVLLATISDAIGRLLPAQPVVNLGAPPPAELELVLYVTSTSQDSHKAIRNLHRALKPYDPHRFRLTIVDVAHGGDDAWYQGLEEDRIIVTPTLVRRRPGPKTWIVGTLAPIDAVEQLLASAFGLQEQE